MEGGARPAADPDEITVRRSDGYFVARDEETGVSSQGDSKEEALENLSEALSLYNESEDDSLDDGLEPSSAPWF